MGIAYTYDDSDLQKRVRLTEARLSNPGPLLRKFGLVLIRSVSANFRQGGRPVPWKKSRRALTIGGQTLVRTARLKNSITRQVTGNRLTIGTSVAYARIHQLGGRIHKNVTVRQHWRTIGKAFGKSIPARSVMVGTHRRMMDTRIPARPFLMIQAADIRVMKRIAADYVVTP